MKMCSEKRNKEKNLNVKSANAAILVSKL